MPFIFCSFPWRFESTVSDFVTLLRKHPQSLRSVLGPFRYKGITVQAEKEEKKKTRCSKI